MQKGEEEANVLGEGLAIDAEIIKVIQKMLEQSERNTIAIEVLTEELRRQKSTSAY